VIKAPTDDDAIRFLDAAYRDAFNRPGDMSQAGLHVLLQPKLLVLGADGLATAVKHVGSRARRRR
jgi:hypothetical protein